MNHILIVGGTGLLWEAALSLAEKYSIVSVIAKNSFRLHNLWEEAHNNGFHINPLQLDYHKENHVKTSIMDAIKEYGPITLVIGRFTEHTDEAPEFLVKEIAKAQTQSFRYFDIVDLMITDEMETAEKRKENLRELELVQYRQIIFGFVIEDSQSRWLTSEEINKGVLKAIEEDNPHCILGETAPISEKP